MDRDAKSQKLSIDGLQDQHRRVFTHAVTNVLSSPIAEVTFAQIIDGLPLPDVALDTYHSNLCPRHPLHKAHTKLCPGVLQRAQQLPTTFDASALQVDAEVGDPFYPHQVPLTLTLNILAHPCLPSSCPRFSSLPNKADRACRCGRAPACCRPIQVDRLQPAQRR